MVQQRIKGGWRREGLQRGKEGERSEKQPDRKGQGGPGQGGAIPQKAPERQGEQQGGKRGGGQAQQPQQQPTAAQGAHPQQRGSQPVLPLPLGQPYGVQQRSPQPRGGGEHPSGHEHAAQRLAKGEGLRHEQGALEHPDASKQGGSPSYQDEEH